jgi:FkbM family methyltransferase
MAGPPDFATLLRDALSLEQQGRVEDALERYRTASAISPGNALPFTRMTVIAARRAWGAPPAARAPAAADKPRVSMSSLGELGRFGNQLLQYAYLRFYAETAGCDVETNDWIGRDLFGLSDPFISKPLARLDEKDFDAARALAPAAAPPRIDVDLAGFFAFSTAAYAHRKAQFRDLFELQGTARAAFGKAWDEIARERRPVIAIHIRRSDFGYGRFWIAPLAWYRAWLDENWPRWRNPVLYIATDDPSIVSGFARYRPLSADYFAAFPRDLAFVLDFFVMARANALAIANSTFSFVAAMMNTQADKFSRPDAAVRKLTHFEPWAAEPLLDPPWMCSGQAVTPQERRTIASFIAPGTTVFDVGANQGEWSRAVQEYTLGRARLFTFEPNPIAFPKLVAWAQTTQPGTTTVVQTALGERAGKRSFKLYEWQDELSGFFRRADPMFDGRPPPIDIEVECTTIDEFCSSHGIRHIHFLKLDVEGAEASVLQGSRRMLSHARIDFIQFEYGGTYRDSGTRLQTVYSYLTSHGYRLFRMASQLEYMPVWNDVFENYQYANFLAVHARLTPYFGIGDRKLPDLAALAKRHGIKVRGAVHVGAHLGEEAEIYRKLGVPRMVLIEANPKLCAQLRARFSDDPTIVIINRAIADTAGKRVLHVTNATQSSSLLPLGRHAEVYPQIVAQESIEVDCARLDDVLGEVGEKAAEYNILNIDVQGAELLVLKGAERILESIDLINAEVNFAELYEGCAQIDEIDDFLEQRGFVRVELACPYHHTWGDAVYLRKR